MTTDGESLGENLGRAIELPEGWRELYLEVIHEIAVIDPHARVVQTKEKFGELRIYMKAFSEPVFGLIDQATKRSRTLCQMCGAAGVWSKTPDGFYATVCSEHSKGFEPATSAVLRHVRLIIPERNNSHSDGQ